MSVDIEISQEEPEVAVLKLHGELGLESVPQISSQIEQFYKAGALHWAVDLSDVEFLSSPAVGVIMGLRSRVIRRGGSVSLFGVAPELSEKLNLMGVLLAIPSFLDWERFLDYFRWEFHDAFRELNMTLPAFASVVPPMRKLLVELLQSKSYSERDAFILETIADELSNNAIEHGNPPDGKFQIRLRWNRKQAEMSVSNHCEALSEDERAALQERYENPQAHPNSLRGRGILLVKKLSSKMTFRVEAEKVEVDIVRMREES